MCMQLTSANVAHSRKVGHIWIGVVVFVTWKIHIEDFVLMLNNVS